MKRLLLCIAFLLFGICLVAQERGMKPVQVTIEGASTTLYNQSHALLIGISNYTNEWSSLPGVNRDIPRLKESLEKNGFQVEVVMNPLTKDALDNAFSDFISKYGNSRDNRLLIYYAGHGHTIKTDWGGELGYIVSADAPLPSRDNSSPFQRKAMEMAQIEIYAKRIQSKHALFIFDACFAGSIFTEDRSGIPEYISYNTAKPVRQFITSGSTDETVADVSFFCDQFIEALDGKADYDKDGYLTGSELGYFLKKEVIKFSNNRQHPQSGKINDSRLDDGDFVFVMPYIGTQSSSRTLTPHIEEERTIVQYGKLEITTKIEGNLFVDGAFMKEVNANSAIILNNLTEGTHIIQVFTKDETVKKEVVILGSQTAYLTIDKKRKVTSSWIPEMIFIEGGTFQMGNNEGNDNEKPEHLVTVNSFYIGKYEITQKQWIDVMGSNPPIFTDCENCPVEQITYTDVQAFISKLNQKLGESYRLPTEAEWEYAAKGGNKSRGFIYSGSNSVGDVAWISEYSGSSTEPVGRKKPNELGLFDMTGNVWELCNDWYDDNYYSKSQTDNPQGPTTGAFHVVRGGAWITIPFPCTGRKPSASSPRLAKILPTGFRLAMDRRPTDTTRPLLNTVSQGNPCPGMPTITDSRDGQVYLTVQIGSQCWLQKNMNYTTGNSWCYDNDPANCNTYGQLYDWETALKVCPSGWHLPSNEEWTILTNFLGGEKVAAGKMKEVGTAHWSTPNIGATNNSGFTALPGGHRYYLGGFYKLTSWAPFWSSTEYTSPRAWSLILLNKYKGVYRDHHLKTTGYSVRCLKD